MQLRVKSVERLLEKSGQVRAGKGQNGFCCIPSTLNGFSYPGNDSPVTVIVKFEQNVGTVYDVNGCEAFVDEYATALTKAGYSFERKEDLYKHSFLIVTSYPTGFVAPPEDEEKVMAGIEEKPVDPELKARLMEAVRNDDQVGRGTCSVIDEAYTDDELWELIKGATNERGCPK